MLTGAEVLIRLAPRVFGQFVQIAAVLPVSGVGGFLHQCFQSLLGGWVAVIVQSVQVELILDHPDILLGLDDAGLVRVIHDARHHDRRQNTENYHHDHHFDQGETT